MQTHPQVQALLKDVMLRKNPGKNKLTKSGADKSKGQSLSAVQRRLLKRKGMTQEGYPPGGMI